MRDKTAWRFGEYGKEHLDHEDPKDFIKGFKIPFTNITLFRYFDDSDYKEDF